MPAPIITTRRLDHNYGSVLALDGLEVDVFPGRTGLVGANGAGKTTLLRILLGMLTPTSGEVQVLGLPVPEAALLLRHRVGYMPENACLPLEQTAADFVGFAAELAGLPADAARKRASETLFLVGLHEERFRYLGDFSTGMRQRVKLAQAIVHDPDLVLLDEPAAGLDPEGRDQMLDLIVRLGELGIDVVFSSHILTDIEQTCQAVVMLDGGRLIRSGPIGDGATGDAVAVEVMGDPAGLVGWLQRQGATVELAGSTLTVHHALADVFDLVRDGLAETRTPVRRLGVTARTLEDLFLEGAGGRRT